MTPPRTARVTSTIRFQTRRQPLWGEGLRSARGTPPIMLAEARATMTSNALETRLTWRSSSIHS